jgi:hypothetical protein
MQREANPKDRLLRYWTVKLLLVARSEKLSLAKRRNSYVPGASVVGNGKGHEPLARAVPRVLEQLTQIQSMYDVLAAPGV